MALQYTGGEPPKIEFDPTTTAFQCSLQYLYKLHRIKMVQHFVVIQSLDKQNQKKKKKNRF